MEINIVELATKLAEIDLRNYYSETDELYELETIDGLCYTKDAQEIFNKYYDYYMDLILSCKQLN